MIIIEFKDIFAFYQAINCGDVLSPNNLIWQLYK